MTIESSLAANPVPVRKRFGEASWRILSVLALALILLILNRGLLTGKATPMWDADGQGAPYQIMVADFATQGRIIGWNPWHSGGSPDFAEPQFGAMSPLAIGIGWVTGGSLAGYCVYWMFWWWLGGVGVLLFGRDLKSPRWACWSVAIGYMLGGLFLSDAEHIPFIIGYSSLGWLIWRLDVAVRERRWWPMMEAGAIWGLSGLSGYPGIVLMNACFGVVWVLGRVLTGGVGKNLRETDQSHVEKPIDPWNSTVNPRWPAWAVGLMATVVFGVVGACILSPTYFGFIYEMRGYTSRSGALPRTMVIETNALHPGAISSLASPFMPIVKLGSWENLWDYTDVSATGFYFGSLPVGLAIMSLVLSPRDKWRWWLVAIGALALGLACSQALPLRGWLYDLFFPARFFRHSALFRCYFIFILAVLALEGAGELTTGGKNGWRKMRWISTGLLIIAMIAVGVVASYTAGFFPMPTIGWVHAGIAWGAVAALAWMGSLKNEAKGYAWLFYAFAIVATLDATGCRLFSAALVETRRPDFVWIWQKLDENHSDNLDLTQVGLQRIIRARIEPEPNEKNLVLKESSLLGDSTLKNSFVLTMAEHPVLSTAITTPERIWFSPSAVESGLSAEEFNAFLTRAKEGGALPAVIHTPETMLMLTDSTSPASPSLLASIQKAPIAEKIKYDLVAYEPDRMVLNVVCPKAGYLWITDRWARSWHATLNGKPVILMGGAFAFRAIQVEAGTNQIAMEYVPMGRSWLLRLSWGLLGVVVIGSFVVALRRSEST